MSSVVEGLSGMPLPQYTHQQYTLLARLPTPHVLALPSTALSATLRRDALLDEFLPCRLRGRRRYRNRVPAAAAATERLPAK